MLAVTGTALVWMVTPQQPRRDPVVPDMSGGDLGGSRDEHGQPRQPRFRKRLSHWVGIFGLATQRPGHSNFDIPHEFSCFLHFAPHRQHGYGLRPPPRQRAGKRQQSSSPAQGRIHRDPQTRPTQQTRRCPEPPGIAADVELRASRCLQSVSKQPLGSSTWGLPWQRSQAGA